MPGGRPRKPVEAKILQGTFRADRDGAPGVQIQADGEPVPEVRLTGKALAFWRSRVPDLVARGLAKGCDGPALTMMCQAWALYWWFVAKMNRPKVKNLTALNTAAAIQFDKFTKIAAQFGLTPGDRAKLRLPGGEKKASGIPTRKRG
jgi:phage terminase small subunit